MLYKIMILNESCNIKKAISLAIKTNIYAILNYQ